MPHRETKQIQVADVRSLLSEQRKKRKSGDLMSGTGERIKSREQREKRQMALWLYQGFPFLAETDQRQGEKVTRAFLSCLFVNAHFCCVLYKQISLTRQICAQVICIFMLTNSFSVAEMWENGMEQIFFRKILKNRNKINNPLKYKIFQGLWGRDHVWCIQLISITCPSCLHMVRVQQIFTE